MGAPERQLGEAKFASFLVWQDVSVEAIKEQKRIIIVVSRETYAKNAKYSKIKVKICKENGENDSRLLLQARGDGTPMFHVKHWGK